MNLQIAHYLGAIRIGEQQLSEAFKMVGERHSREPEPRELDVWLHSAMRVAKALNPYLAPDDLAPVWTRIMGSACYAGLADFQRRWLAVFQAVGARNAALAGAPDASAIARA